MKRPWLRLYRDAIRNPKVGRLSLEGMGFWVALLMLSKDDGSLPSIEDVAWHLRLTPEEAESHLSILIRHGLVTRDVTRDGHGDVTELRLHDWDEHQCVSDADLTAKDRKQRQREREKAQKSAVTRDVTDVSRVTSRTRHGDVTRTESESESEKKNPPYPPLTSETPKATAAADGVFDGFCLAMNLTPKELLRLGATWSMVKSEYATWIAAGAIPDLDIWPTVKSVTEKFRDNNPGMNAPSTPKYFTQAILRAIEVRKVAMAAVTSSNVIIGPNGKPLAPNGKPWHRHPADAIWIPEYRTWLTRQRLVFSIEDATQKGEIDPLVYDLDLKPRPWLPEWARILVQDAGEPANPVCVMVHYRKLSSWPVRAPKELQRVLKDYFIVGQQNSNVIPGDWKPAEVAA